MDVDEAQVGRTISRLVAENGQLQAEVRRLQGILDGTEPAEGSWQTEALALRAELRVMRARAQHLAQYHRDPAVAGAARQILGGS